jgi:hypothetical protein
MITPLENVEALSKQTEIKYGPVKGGSTENFFKVNFFCNLLFDIFLIIFVFLKESKVLTYMKMWNYMSKYIYISSIINLI